MSADKIWDQAIEAAANFVESHMIYPYAKDKLKPIEADRRQHYRKTNPARVLYAEALRERLKGKRAEHAGA